MSLTHKQLIGLPVETRSGLLLGKIKSFEVDSGTQTILRYVVKSRSLVSKLLAKKDQRLIIHRNQVISIDEKKMIVEDNAIKENVTQRMMKSMNQEMPVFSVR